MKNYTEAQKQYEMAILIRKQLPKDHKMPPIVQELVEKYSDVELKFRVAKCMVENQLFKEACALLQPLPLKQRSSKINMLLAKIQQGESGTDKNRIANYKEVLRKSPLAFECIDGLISLGVRGAEVNSLIINGELGCGADCSPEGADCSRLILASSTECFNWINTYIRGMAELRNHDYAEAVMTLTSIDCLKMNSKILASIGEAFYFSGDYDRANQYLKRAYELNPFMKHGIQKYALLCDMFKKTKELEMLLRPSSAYPYEYTSENWFVMAVYLYSVSKYDKAQYFINRVITQHQFRNVDAHILNAKILHSTKKSSEALISLRTALKYEPCRFEAYRWIIEILLTSDHARDAQNQATKMLKLIGETPRCLTLAASTFLKAPINKEKAKTLLLKALEINEHYTKAVFFLAQILIDDKENKAAIKLLEKTAAVVSNVKICLMLADLYAKCKNLSLALEFYTKVLNLDSSNRHALNGLMALGSTNSSIEKALQVSSTTCGENDDSSAEIEPSGDASSRMKTNDDDESSELVWSDVEMDTA